jgi:hypothetical protein
VLRLASGVIERGEWEPYRGPQDGLIPFHSTPAHRNQSLAGLHAQDSNVEVGLYPERLGG